MKLSPIDLNLLVALDAVLQEGSMGRAAALLGISKPAMSHAMARLRAQIGDPIVVRAGQRWVLSDRAQALAPTVRGLVADAFSALAPGGGAVDLGKERQYRVHTTDHVLSLLGVELARALAREAPRASIRFLPLLDEEAGALREDVDLAIGAFHEMPDDLRQQRLFREPYACVVRKGHPKVRGKLTLPTFVELDHVVIAPRGRPGGLVDTALRKRKLRRRVVQTLPFFAVAFELVAESDCVATVSERLAKKHAERYGLQALEPPLALPPCTVAQVWHARVDADAGHTWLRKLIARIAHAAARAA
jgi:DNA-binding transcriptional LysR family regulator